MWKKAFRSTKSFAVRFGGEPVLMLVIGIFVALILAPIDPLKFITWFSPSIPNIVFVGFYTVIVLVNLYLLVFLVKLTKEHSEEEKEKYITRLAEDRTKGVGLRNSLKEITAQKELDDAITRYHEWDEAMLEALAFLSPGESAWLRTLDWMPEASGIFLSGDHKRYVRVMNEKLRRIDKILCKHLEIPQR